MIIRNVDEYMVARSIFKCFVDISKIINGVPVYSTGHNIPFEQNMILGYVKSRNLTFCIINPNTHKKLELRTFTKDDGNIKYCIVGTTNAKRKFSVLLEQISLLEFRITIVDDFESDLYDVATGLEAMILENLTAIKED